MSLSGLAQYLGLSPRPTGLAALAPQVPTEPNQPFGELSAGPAPTPTQRFGNSFQDALEYAGAQPSVARHLREGIGGIFGLTPLGAIGAAADTVDAKRRGDGIGVVQGMAGMIPGAKAAGGAAARYVDALAQGKITKAEYDGFMAALEDQASTQLAAASPYASSSAARSQMNEATRISDEFYKKYQNDRLTPDEYKSWRDAIKQKSDAQQYLLNTEGRFVQGYVPSENPVVDDARRRLSLESDWMRNQEKAAPSWSWRNRDK
jgi:hypothetical protein